MTDENVPGYVYAPVRARVAQAALILHVLASGGLHALSPLVLAIYGETGYREDGAGLDLLTHGLFSIVMFLISVFAVLMALATPTAVLAWLYRASKNAHAIATGPLEHSPAMAIGWWFVPVANLWQPLGVVREIETTGDPDGNIVSSSDTGWWWGGYLVGNIVGFAAGDALHPNGMHIAAGVIASVAHAVSAFMLIRIIDRIRTNQESAAKRRRWAEVFEDDDPTAGAGDDAPAPAAF